MKHEVQVVKHEQTAIPGVREKITTLYYLLIGEGEKKVIINVGSMTYEKINKLNEKQTK